MVIQKLTVHEVYEYLHTGVDGLSSVEVNDRLKEYGLNVIHEVVKKSSIKKFLKHFIHIFALLLWFAAFLCFYMAIKHPEEGLLNLGIAIVIVIIINGIFSFYQERQAEKVLLELKKLLPNTTKVIRDGVILKVPVYEIVPGDLILLNEGDKVPADARIVDAENLFVNNAPLTGESDPMPRNHHPYDGDFLDSPNILFAGTIVTTGRARGVCFATGMSTEFGKIAHITTGIKKTTSTLQIEIKKITKFIGFFSILTGIVFFIFGVMIGRTFIENFVFAVGIIIANVPEGLLPTVTISLAMSAQRMAKKNALIKSLNAIETLGSVTVICTDKTGTLTKNKMLVKELWIKTEKERLFEIGYFCNNVYIENGNQLHGDPTEVAIMEYVKNKVSKTGTRLKEKPFDAERKRMSVLYEVGGDRIVYVKGAVESVLPLCETIEYENISLTITSEIKSHIEEAYNKMADKGLRVLGFAYKHYKDNEELEEKLNFVGLMGLEDPPHEDVPEAISKCKKAGIRIIMITGDAEKTAIAIGKEVGIIPKIAKNGKSLDALSDSELKDILKDGDLIFYRMTPLEKLRIVRLLKEMGEIVAVTGDGVNDAPALKSADIGISMGLSGEDVSKEVAHIVLLDDNFSSIVNAIEEGRAVFENIRNFITYIFSSNIPEIIPYIAYVIFRIPLPLTIMQILAVDLGTDMFPALALGAEKPTQGIMERPPRKQNERLLNMQTILRSYFFLGPLEALAGLFGYYYVMTEGFTLPNLSTSSEIYLQATTACFAAIVVTQVANGFVCRSYYKSPITLGLFSNRLLLFGIAMEFMITFFVIYTPIGNSMFQTKAISLNTWLVLLPFMFLVFFADELRKIIMKK